MTRNLFDVPLAPRGLAMQAKERCVTTLRSLACAALNLLSPVHLLMIFSRPSVPSGWLTETAAKPM